MVKYEFVLKNERIRRYHFLAWLFIFLNLLFLLFVSFSKDHPQAQLLFFVLLGIVLVTLFFGRVDTFNLRQKNPYLWICYLTASTCWFILHIYWMFISLIGLYFLYGFATRRFKIILSSEEILIPSLLKGVTKWNDLNNVILKDGILTIDYKTNKLLQNEIEEDDFINEQEFNDFCKQQLKGNNQSK